MKRIFKLAGLFSVILLIFSLGYADEWIRIYRPSVEDIFVPHTQIVDRTKDSKIITSTINISAVISDNDNFTDILVVNATIIMHSGKEIRNLTMSCSQYNTTHGNCSCIWDTNSPENLVDPENLELGNYDVRVKVIDREGLSDNLTENNVFEVKDLNISITKFYGNTTDFFIEGNAEILLGRGNIGNILSVAYCGYSKPLYLDGPTEKCGIARNCNLIPPGNFSCYINDLKLTDKLTNVSFIISTNDSEVNLSGYENKIINLDGTIKLDKIDDPNYVNIYQPINYTINFSNTRNIGWYGEIYNQTRVRVFSSGTPEEVTLPTHISLDYSDNSSWINLANGTTGNFSHFLGKSYYVLGNYNYTANLSYFWPEFNETYGFTPLNFTVIEREGKTNYTVAAIDITDYSLSREVIRGDRIIGKVRGYFVGSMDIYYWEEVQGDTFKVTDNTTTGKFWVEKWDISDPTNPTKIGTEIGSETNPENMTWNRDFWEAKINSFDLSCDNESTVHRVYFLINWTDYNIYVPYVKGEFKPEFWPYFYQNLTIKCVSRELFEVNPEIANVALGEKNRNIFNISIQNPKNESLDVDILIIPKEYKEVINWLSFTTGTSSCGSDCINTTITLSANGGGSTIVHLNEASRVGNYPLEVIVKDSSTGEELYRKKVYLNIFSEALGSNNLFYLLLLFFVTSILLIKRNYEQ